MENNTFAPVVTRRLVTIRTIDKVQPIENADAIEVVVIGGWHVVVKRGEFAAGDQCVYFEIDSFLPDGEPAWQFLVDKSNRMFEGVKGHKLRTIRLRGQCSQGFVVPISASPLVELAIGRPIDAEKLSKIDGVKFNLARKIYSDMVDNNLSINDLDFTELLDIKKWEATLPAEMVGQAAGLFPSFIRKTDQERCQNIVANIFGYEDIWVPFSVDGITDSNIQGLISGGIIREVQTDTGVEYQKLLPAKADKKAQYEITMKMDGSSMTVFGRGEYTEPVKMPDGTFDYPVQSGVCSRNLQLKINEENAENTFVKMAVQSGLLSAVESLAKEEYWCAVQGELMGPGIQGNRENFAGFRFFVFDVFNIKTQKYLTPAERAMLLQELYSRGVNPLQVLHVPVMHKSTTLDAIGITNISELLAYAEGPSIMNPVREGVVFKRVDGGFSFKAISNRYLIAEK